MAFHRSHDFLSAGKSWVFSLSPKQQQQILNNPYTTANEAIGSVSYCDQACPRCPGQDYQPLADNKQELGRVNELLSCTGRSQKEAKQQIVSMVICSTTFHSQCIGKGVVTPRVCLAHLHKEKVNVKVASPGKLLRVSGSLQPATVWQAIPFTCCEFGLGFEKCLEY